jgi:hypothetical protein
LSRASKRTTVTRSTSQPKSITLGWSAIFQKARDYHDAARELASESQSRDPNFTDKERINLEIYAERQNDEAIREQFLELARSDAVSDREIAAGRDR